MTKRGVVLDMRVVVLIGGGLVWENFARESVYIEGCVRVLCILFFLV